MAHRWEIRIGTRTTPRKQSPIRAALAGTMWKWRYDYVQPGNYLAECHARGRFAFGEKIAID